MVFELWLFGDGKQLNKPHKFPNQFLVWSGGTTHIRRLPIPHGPVEFSVYWQVGTLIRKLAR